MSKKGRREELFKKLIEELVKVNLFPKEIQYLPWEVESNIKAALEMVAVDPRGDNEFEGVFMAMERIDLDLMEGFDVAKMDYEYKKDVLIREFISRNLENSRHFCLSKTPGSDGEFLKSHEIYSSGHA